MKREGVSGVFVPVPVGKEEADVVVAVTRVVGAVAMMGTEEEEMVGMFVLGIIRSWCRSRTVMLFVTVLGFEASEEMRMPIFAVGGWWW